MSLPLVAPPKPPPPVGPPGWSFRALWEAFAKMLPAYLRRLGVPECDIEDAVQETLITVWENVESIPLDTREARREVFRRLARVACIMRRKAARRARLVVLAADDHDLEAPDSVDVAAWIEMRGLVLDALDALDPQTRALLIAIDLEERSYLEVAQLFGCTRSKIKNRLHQGRARLQVQVDRLLGKRRGKRAEFAPLGLLGLNAFDKAAIRAVLAAEAQTAPPVEPSPPPSSGVFPAIVGAGALVPVLGIIAAAAFVAQLFLLHAPSPLPASMGRASLLPSESIASAVVAVAVATAAPSLPEPTSPRQPRANGGGSREKLRSPPDIKDRLDELRTAFVGVAIISLPPLVGRKRRPPPPK